MKKIILISGLLSIFLFSNIRAEDQVEKRILRSPYLEISAWADRGEGSRYYPGDNIKVYFKTSRDAYVVIYNVDSKGYVNVLFPTDSPEAGLVRGDRTYIIPDDFEDYDLTVDGPQGTEYIQAIASLDPFTMPYFRDGEDQDYDYDEEEESFWIKDRWEDPYDFMDRINRRIIPYGYRDYALDLCIFNVEYRHPPVYYTTPVYINGYPDYYSLGGFYCLTEPYGAAVYIDGIFYGYTPLTVPRLITGFHFVSVYYYGHRIWWDRVYIRPSVFCDVRVYVPNRYHYYYRTPVIYKFKDYRVKYRKDIYVPQVRYTKVKDFKSWGSSDKTFDKVERPKDFRKSEAAGRSKTEFKSSTPMDKKFRGKDSGITDRKDPEKETKVLRKDNSIQEKKSGMESGKSERNIQKERNFQKSKGNFSSQRTFEKERSFNRETERKFVKERSVQKSERNLEKRSQKNFEREKTYEKKSERSSSKERSFSKPERSSSPKYHSSGTERKSGRKK